MSRRSARALTTCGTGSDAQSYALISQAGSRRKMACGDTKALFRTVVLDPELTISAPKWVRSVAGYDAIAHAVESLVTTRATSGTGLPCKAAGCR